MTISKWLSLIVLLLYIPENASALQLTVTQTGRGSGTLNGVPFPDSDFIITSIMDTANRVPISSGNGWYIPNTSASIQIAGVGTFDFVTTTRIFVNHNGAPGFSRYFSGGGDLFNGPSNSVFTTWDMLTSIGPVSGTGFLLQWGGTFQPVNTTGGVLVFNGGSSPTTFTATLEPRPHITCSPISITRYLRLFQPVSNDLFSVANTSVGTLSYTISPTVEWVSVTPAEGTSANGQANTHEIMYDISTLDVATYTASINVIDPGAENSPQTINITLIVEPIPGDMDIDLDVDQTDFGAFQNCLSGPAINQPNPACELANIDGDTDVDSADFDIFKRCMSGADIQANPNCAD